MPDALIAIPDKGTGIYTSRWIVTNNTGEFPCLGLVDLSYFHTDLSKFGFDREEGLKLSGTLPGDEARIHAQLVPDKGTGCICTWKFDEVDH